MNTSVDARRANVLTNMAFRQSRLWQTNTHSIYDNLAFRDTDSMPSWVQAVQLLRQRGTYDVVVTMGARESLAYGLLCAITGRTSKQIMCEVFLDDPQPGNPLWRLKIVLYRLVARRSLGILTNSSAEVETTRSTFNVQRSTVKYVPMHTNIPDPHVEEQDDGFILSAGRSRRDYPALLDAAPSINAPITIVCGRDDLRGMTVPANVTVLREAPRAVYLDHLRRCSVVAVPLLETQRATGQVVVLEAMGLGKPVVATRAPGTVDHVIHGETGYLVDPGSSRDFTARINELLADRERARAMGRRAVAEVLQHSTFDRHAEVKLAAIRELWEMGGGNSKLVRRRRIRLRRKTGN